ncbi:MAG: M24 family metallopeptidase, partial [Dehalococcoidia bacterium]
AGEAAMRKEFARRFPDFEYIRGRISFRAGPRLWGHHDPIARKVQRGDLIFMSAHPIIMGYFSTLARQRVMGEIDDSTRRPFEVCIQAVDRCLEAIKPGVRFSEIDNVALKVFEEAGVAQYKGFGTGHSHGLMGPFWGREKCGEYRPYNDTLLQPGVITSMEPSLSIPGVGVFMINDMVLVTESGAEVITHYPRELRSIQ